MVASNIQSYRMNRFAFQ